MTVKVNKPRDMQALFLKAQKDAEKHGITWSGDMQAGRGEGFGFEGKYVVDENHIIVTVTKRPLFASKSRIEREVKSYILAS